MTYSPLGRTWTERGILGSGGSLSEVTDQVFHDYDMDLLGNLTPTAGGLKVNSTNASITHAVNVDNEITTLDRPNPSGLPRIIEDDFSSLSGIWTQAQGSWSISNGAVQADPGEAAGAALLTNAEFDIASYKVDVWFPTTASTAKAGVLLTYKEGDHGLMVVLDRDNDRLALHSMSEGTWGAALASSSATINDETWYTIHVMRRQRTIRAWIDDGNTTKFTYCSNNDFGTGKSGLYASDADIKFDNFVLYDMTARDPKFPRITGSANVSISSGELLVTDDTHYDEAIVEDFFDDDYMVQVDMKMNSGKNASIWVRYVDANNGYQAFINAQSDPWQIDLLKWVDGSYTSLDSGTFSAATSLPIKIKVDGTSIEVWVDGTREINTTDSAIDAGGVALGGDQPKFDNLKIGYDVNDDDDIDDAGDYLVMNEDFSSTSLTPVYDDNGNLIDDGTFIYTYDAWNRLVKVQAAKDTDVTIQEAEFDGLGRRIKKVVTNSDETVKYYYNGWRIIETRDGNDNLYQQFIHGILYIDELVMMRVKDKGDLYIHQDANWNVIALTDLGGHVVERYTYKPYGEFVVNQETSYGDYDGDQDVDTTDRDAYDGNSPTGAQRILDLDFD